MTEPTAAELYAAMGAIDCLLAGDHATARRILATLDDDVLARVNAAAGDLRILAAEAVAQRAARHTPPAVAAAHGTTGARERDRMGATAEDDSGGAT